MKKKKNIEKKYENDGYELLELSDEINSECEESEFLEDEQKNITDKSDLAYDEYRWLLSVKEDPYRVNKVRALKKERIFSCITKGLGFALILDLLIMAAINPKIQYRVRSLVGGDLKSDENNLEYAKYVIYHNETISSDVKEYLLAFFDNIMNFNDPISIDSMIRMTNRITKYDFSNVDLSDKKKTILMLNDIITPGYGISSRCLSQEFYEYYFNTGPSKKSLLFDALNGGADSSLAVRIINGGDSEYYAYLTEKYGFSEDEIKRIHDIMVEMQVTEKEDVYDFNYYINRLLTYYNREFDFLKRMEAYFNGQDIEDGNITYNGNLFSDNATITVNEQYLNLSYDVYYDKKFKYDVTDSQYLKKFCKLVENFDRNNIDRDNPTDRLMVYLHTLWLLYNNKDCLDQDIDEYSYYFYLYSVGKEIFSKKFYNYLNEGDFKKIVESSREYFGYDNITRELNDALIKTYFRDILMEEQLTLFAESLLCLQHEVSEGYLPEKYYDSCYDFSLSIISEMLGEEFALEFQNMINQGVNNWNVGDLIKRIYYHIDVVSLELTSN